MTDTLTEPLTEDSGPLTKVCAADGCEQPFVVSPKGFGPKRLYCDDHVKPKKAPPKDKRPRSVSRVNIDLRPPRTSSKDKELDLVRERCAQLLGVVQVLLVSIGQADDAADVGNAKQAVADAARELAKYEEWLRKLAAGGDATGRALAWVTMIGALLGLLVPILARHKVIPEDLAKLLGTEVVIVDLSNSAGGDSQPDREPAAASVA